MDLSSELIMDGIPVPPIRLSVQVKDVMAPGPVLNLSKASCKIKGGLPGLLFSAEGALSKMGLNGQMDLDLAPLTNVVRPFLSASFPNPSGKIQLTLKALLNPEEVVDFHLRVKGTELSASGGTLKKNRVGPINLAFSQEGALHLKKGDLFVKSGEIQIQDRSRVSFQAALGGLNGPHPRTDITLNSLVIDLKELLLLGGPFIPEGISFGTKQETSLPSELSAKSIRLTGSLPEGSMQLGLNDVSVSFPVIRVKTENGTLSAEALSFQLQKGNVQMTSNFPSQADFLAGLKLKNLQLTGKKTIRLKRLAFSTLRVVAKDVVRSKGSLFGLKGNVTFHESGTLQGVAVAKQIQIPSLRHTSETRCIIGSERPITINAFRARISAPAFHLETHLYGPIDSGLELTVDLSDLRLMDLEPLQVDVERVRTGIDVKNLFNVRTETSIRDLGRESLKTEGNVTLNLDEIVPRLATRLPHQLDLKGVVNLEWKFQGRLPTEMEKKGFSTGKEGLYKKLQNTGFLQDLRVTANLKDVAANVPLSKNGRLKASQIRTEAPLILKLSKGLKEGSVSGKLSLGRIEELPSLGRLKTPLQVSLSLSGAQEELRSIRFSEAIDVEPLGINQSLDLSLNRIDHFLRKGPGSPLAAFLEKGEGSIIARISAGSAEKLSFLKKGLALKGSVKAGLQIDLTGENEIRAMGRLDSSGLDLKYGQKMEITDLKTHLEVRKNLLLGRPGKRHSHKDPTPDLLSREVLQSQAETPAFTEAQRTMAKRLMDDLRGRLASQPAVTFASASIEAGNLPLKISNYELNLRLIKSLPSVDHFQFDLMGGSVVGELYVRKDPKGFELEAGCSFSGLNPNLLLPRPIQQAQDRQPDPSDPIDLSGQISLRVPLTSNPEQLLYGTRLTLRLTHIGYRTFERFLYALDPYESNEGIVKQRELLRMGTPLWITLAVRYGNLSLSGEVLVKGVRIRLPRIERFNMAGLPIHARLETSLSALGPLVELLKTISADGIIVKKDGTIRLVSSGP